ncbi:MAG: 16S rRNA (uracil(1498)-N(3))-methyltransferase [Alphaproteobacteria bacterium]|nr:16S rRNA (uracil(1498)-N(3))-methyltransferase [Alphaproteobacteria bacterium]
MQNIPRIFINEDLNVGKTVQISKEIKHYLQRVMRRKDCLIFNNGVEYAADLSDDGKYLIVKNKTEHIDPSNNITLYFAPIKRLDDMLNMVTQMGVAVLQPVVTDRTVANHINWERMKKIIIEASEQSNRNSIPLLLNPIRFSDMDLSDVIVADERAGHGKKDFGNIKDFTKILIGPEGGFSVAEFEKMDKSNVCCMSLGKTILRAEVASVVAVSKVLNK